MLLDFGHDRNGYSIISDHGLQTQAIPAHRSVAYAACGRPRCGYGHVSAMSILFCARPGHASAGFGAVVRRDDLPSYLGFAIAVEEAGHDIHRQLGVLLEGGVEDQDVNIVTGLMAATAQQVWREKNLTADQIRCVSIVLSTAGTQVDLTLWRRN
jgi:hypothetical protein